MGPGKIQSYMLPRQSGSWTRLTSVSLESWSGAELALLASALGSQVAGCLSDDGPDLSRSGSES